MAINKVIMVGRLTRDPELKHTTQGTPVIEFSLALNKGEGKADFFECKAWRNTAEFISRYFRKGDGIGIVGHLSSRSYEKNGEKRTVYYVEAEEVSFPDGKRSDGEGTNTAPTEKSSYSAKYDPTEASKFETMEDDSDLPF
jgi:single-strand DNA-binding protein